VTDALIRRLQQTVRSGRWVDVLFASQPRVPPPPPADPGVVAAAEAEVGFGFPDLLRRMYLEVANGGFGPCYGLLGLDGGATDDIGYNALDQWFNARQDMAAARRRKPLRELTLFPCFYAGCNEYSCLDCRNADGPMWRYDLSRRPARFEPEGFTLAGLMERWAEGPTSAEPAAAPDRGGTKAPRGSRSPRRRGR